jgi:ferric-dicitrate binding protein FerR (iron transport regulator)
VNDEQRFIDRITGELNAQVEGQAPATLGRLRAARREALAAAQRPAPRRHWLPALAASLIVAVVSSVIWFELRHTPELELESLLQTASIDEQQLIDEGDDIELYRDLEFYYWLEQEQAHAG